MDTKQLAAFCAVVERGSFSQAAERLGVTQPEVSRLERRSDARVSLVRSYVRALGAELEMTARFGDEAIDLGASAPES